MDEQVTMLDVVCYSEKEKVSLGFGFSISREELENKRISDPSDIAVGIGDSYYELWEEFEPGIEITKKLYQEKRFSSVKEALVEVFGHFNLSFSINGAEIELDYDFDVDECVFDTIMDSNPFEDT